MATTTNYGWTTPNDTDLVKDGAAAIRTLGSSVDTTTKALNPSTTLGDIEYRSATANTNTRLGIGSTGNVLTVAGGVPTWAAPSAGVSYTQLATGSLSGNTVSVTGLNSDNLIIFYSGANSAGSPDLNITINSDATAANYVSTSFDGTNMVLYDAAFAYYVTGVGVASGMFGYFTVNGCKSAGVKPISFVAGRNNTSSFRIAAEGFYKGSAITSVQIKLSGSNTFNAGTYYVYGAN